MADSPQERAVRQLLANFDTYDQYVDVVSAFEWVFTGSNVQGMPTTVRYFERFPKVRAGDGTELTPDFTVLFVDGSAIIGEIAKVGLAEESVDHLCQQLSKYATVPQVPDGPGSVATVSHVDVMCVTPMKTGLDAYERIVVERYGDSAHPFNPPEPPCIVQFSRDESSYTFQRIRADKNGVLIGGTRDPHIQKYLDRGFSPPVQSFIRVKVARPYINDPVDVLYLATQLWTRVWPDRHGGPQAVISVDPRDTAEYLRERYGYVRTKDVRRALELLDSVGLAASDEGGTWLVALRMLGNASEKDVHRVIANRLLRRQRRVEGLPVRREAAPRQGTLFDL